MVRIKNVITGSFADKAGIKPADTLVSINKNEICDVLDYRFYLAERRVELLLSSSGGEYSVTIKKGQYDDIGLEFESALMDEKHSCKNGCIFCFIDQNPKGMRDTIYFKDDDSRLSFIHGNYITLTNMSDKDIERIVKMRISPINISIHTTNPELRVKMMKNKRSGDVLKYLRTFADAGLSMCGQIVLCKGVNDGEELMRSMRDLSAYFPSLSSVSIVPAGLTKFRDGLYPLADFSREEAKEIIGMVEDFSDRHKASFGSRLFYLADEFYLKADLPIPPDEYYEDYQQIENGVGMLRSMSEEFSYALEDTDTDGCDVRRVAVATGYASYPMISSMAREIEGKYENLKIDVYKIKNNFFGESITVSGLLTGRDIFEQLNGRLSCDELILPSCALRASDMDFLCGMKLSELSEKLGVKIRLSDNDGYDFLDAVLGK